MSGPGFTDTLFLAFTGCADAKLGRPDEARKKLDRLDGLRSSQYVDFFGPVELSAALRDHQKVMLWLQRGYDQHSAFWVYMPMAREIYAGDREAEDFIRQHPQ
jgi:hypothetical protein